MSNPETYFAKRVAVNGVNSNQFHKIQVNNRQEMMHSSPVYVTMNMIKYGSCSVMEQFADIRVDRVNIQMEAEDADRTEI